MNDAAKRRLAAKDPRYAALFFRAAPKPLRRISYGVTTVEDRRDTLLPRTLASLAAAGFPRPRLFVDGDRPPQEAEYRARFGLDVTFRCPRVRTVGNWVLALWELYLRDPRADLYLVAQDDAVFVANLRPYLERAALPEQFYGNLYGFPSNERLAPVDESGNPRAGFYPSNQLGKGAVALVFPRDAVVALLSSRRLAMKPQDAARGHKSLDGAVVEAMREQGFKEYCHFPSLTQHTGDVSSMGNRRHPQAASFPGEHWDAMSLLATPAGV